MLPSKTSSLGGRGKGNGFLSAHIPPPGARGRQVVTARPRAARLQGKRDKRNQKGPFIAANRQRVSFFEPYKRCMEKLHGKGLTTFFRAVVKLRNLSAQKNKRENFSSVPSAQHCHFLERKFLVASLPHTWYTFVFSVCNFFFKQLNAFLLLGRMVAGA